MTSTKIDVSSTVLEKGLDLAKTFLEKMILPAVEEVGLLAKDKVTLWKLKNQVNMLNKARAYCEKNGIKTKAISLKLLCPLLDFSAIEEEPILQDKWAILLSNMIDSEKNIQNHVFPFILSQLSINEFQILDHVYTDKLLRVQKFETELAEYSRIKDQQNAEFDAQIAKIDIEIAEVEKRLGRKDYSATWEMQKRKREIEHEKWNFKYRESALNQKITAYEIIPQDSLKEFELSNVIRLGLVKEEKEFYANPQSIEIPENDNWGFSKNVDVNIDMDSETSFILTELGDLFMSACKEKQQPPTEENIASPL